MQCKTCTNDASNCLECAVSRIAAPTCLCPQGYFDSGVAKCSCKYGNYTLECDYSCYLCIS